MRIIPKRQSIDSFVVVVAGEDIHPFAVMDYVTPVKHATPALQTAGLVHLHLHPLPIVEMARVTGQKTVAAAPKTALVPINVTIVPRLNTNGQHGLNVEHPVET